jgi:hypothetical protein
MNVKPHALIFSPLLFLVALAGLGPATPAQPAQAAEPAAAYQVYLPVIRRSPSLIYGRVSEGGASAAGVTVSLRFFNGAAWATQAAAQTDATGRFEFWGQAPLSGAQRYQVVFENGAGNDARLAWWGTRHLASFGTDSQAHIGDFDIAAVRLGEPGHNAAVGLPSTFRWTRRSATPSDSYALRVYDSSDLNPLYVSPYMGYGESFTLNSLPGGFATGINYTWDVILIAPDGATGVSREARAVRFHHGIHGRVTLNGAAAGGVALQLRYFNGATWSTYTSTVTAGDGSYAFTTAPTLGTGQKLYVRYQNVTQTAGRLFLWSTRTVTAYSAGTALDLGSFDIGDVGLISPAAGASVSLPSAFQWTRRPATPSDSYIVEIYDPSDYQPRWLSPVLGYADTYILNSLASALATYTPYAWDIVISSPDGGSGVSRVARLVQFTNRGGTLGDDDEPSAEWPFDEELPPRTPEDVEGEELIDFAFDRAREQDATGELE